MHVSSNPEYGSYLVAIDDGRGHLVAAAIRGLKKEKREQEKKEKEKTND